MCLATAAAANPNCPSNLVQAGNLTRNTTDSTDFAGYSSYCEFGSASATASYDIPAGVYYVSATDNGECGISARVTVQDDFRVIGLPAGSSVPIVAVLHANVGGAVTTMTDADGHQVTLFAGLFDGVSGEVSLPIAAIAEQPFRLTFDARTSADYQSGGGVSADFHFGGLPPGAAVTSCNGYVGDHAVPTKVTSWGKLKSMYR